MLFTFIWVSILNLVESGFDQKTWQGLELIHFQIHHAVTGLTLFIYLFFKLKDMARPGFGLCLDTSYKNMVDLFLIRDTAKLR